MRPPLNLPLDFAHLQLVLEGDTDIVIRRVVTNPHSDRLREEIVHATKQK